VPATQRQHLQQIHAILLGQQVLVIALVAVLMAHSDLLCLALAWKSDRPDDRSWPQPNQWTWD
jgi:hypothetical protein